MESVGVVCPDGFFVVCGACRDGCRGPEGPGRRKIGGLCAGTDADGLCSDGAALPPCCAGDPGMDRPVAACQRAEGPVTLTVGTAWRGRCANGLPMAAGETAGSRPARTCVVQAAVCGPGR